MSRIPHEGQRIEPAIQWASLIDATSTGYGIERRAEIPLSQRVLDQIDL
jgi:hypothetical protein